MFYEIQLYLIVAISGSIIALQLIKNINRNKILRTKKEKIEKKYTVYLEFHVDNSDSVQK